MNSELGGTQKEGRKEKKRSSEMILQKIAPAIFNHISLGSYM